MPVALPFASLLLSLAGWACAARATATSCVVAAAPHQPPAAFSCLLYAPALRRAFPFSTYVASRRTRRLPVRAGGRAYGAWRRAVRLVALQQGQRLQRRAARLRISAVRCDAAAYASRGGACLFLCRAAPACSLRAHSCLRTWRDFFGSGVAAWPFYRAAACRHWRIAHPGG